MFGKHQSREAWTAKLGKMKSRAQQLAKARGFEENFRSGLELQVGIILKHFKVPYGFESEVIPWVRPASDHKYIPDFKITTRSGKVLYIETKGLLDKQDPEKHQALKQQYPQLDIRIIFSNPHTWDRAAKTRTYAKWADKVGIKWTSKARMQKTLKEWINE